MRPLFDAQNEAVPLTYFNIVKLKRGEAFEYRVPGYETCIAPATGTVDVDVEGALFVSSFFKEAPDPVVSSFVSRFTQAYGVEPTLLEALGYDTMRMITSAVTERGAFRRNSMRDALSRTNDFAGVAGKTTFGERGDAKRRMWILTVRGGRIEALQ